MADVETVVLRQGARLDWGYIDTHLRPLAELKGQPQILTVYVEAASRVTTRTPVFRCILMLGARPSGDAAPLP